MYTPSHFKKNEREVIDTFIEKYNFSLVLTHNKGQPVASHLPLLLEKSKGPNGTLIGHMARANPQWKDFQEGQNVLCVFSGPHAYVSPSWYVEELNVPTWNYTAVHVYGKAKIIDDNDGLQKILAATVDFQERPFKSPWKFELPEEYKTKLMKAIVGFEIEIQEVQGKFKLSQNRSPQDRLGAIKGLSSLNNDVSRALVAMMKIENEKP